MTFKKQIPDKKRKKIKPKGDFIILVDGDDVYSTDSPFWYHFFTD